MNSNLIPITRIYDIYPKYTYSKDVKRFMDEIVDIPREDVVRIPDNTTNGDVIKALFPDLKITRELKDVVTVYALCPDGNEFVIHFDSDWWNAPYRRDENESYSNNL